MGRWIDEYDDVEEQLEELENDLSDLASKIEDIPTDVDYYAWKKGCYEDVECDLENKLQNFRNAIIKLIDNYNCYIEDGEDYADRRFENCFKNKKIEVLNNDNKS